MKKFFTLIAMAAMALGANAQDWNASNAEALANGTKILDNDYVKINTAVQDTEATLIKDESNNPDPKTFGGFTFTKYVNIRVDAGPAESNNWEGTAYGDATPLGISLIVKAKKNTDVTLYYKHGAGKVLSCYDQTAKSEVAIAETAADGLENYYTGVFKFISGHTYTIYARGGTTGLSGIKTDEGTYVEPSTTVYAYNSDANLVTYADGATMQITGNTDKKYGGGANITISGATYKGIKNSNGAENTFTAATGKKIYRMVFYAIPNKDGEEPNFKEFNGVTFAEPIAITSTKDGTNPTQIIMCGNGLESATFTFAGKQVNFAIEVDYSESAYDAQYDPAAPVTTETWTVAGSGAILGSTWDPADATNDMTTTDGKIYTLVKENCTLETGTVYEYKVAKDHGWGESYPGANAQLTVNETAIYKVTFTFNSETKEVSAEAVKTGEAGVVEHTYDVKGNFFNDSNWEKTYPMTKDNDGNWSVTIDGLDAGEYEFKVRQDNSWDVAYPASNYKVSLEAASSLTIKFFPESKNIETTVTPTTGISAINADQQNAVVYNLAGQKVSENYKGVVIKNGRKMIQ